MLSKRLNAIAQLIDTEIIYDVGCDHALLDIYLSNNRKIKCIAIDKSKECVKKALENVKKNNSNVLVLHNDGLTNIDILSNSTVVISGMGTKNIMEIIKDKNIENLICQSNKNIYELRKNVCNLGYYIVDERIVFKDKYYIIIKFKKGNVIYNEDDYFLGPILRKIKNNVYVDYLEEQKKKIEKNMGKYDLNKKQKYLLFLDIVKRKLKD